MPLLSRYLRSSQQISRLRKIAEKEKTARGRHRRKGGGGATTALPCPQCGWADYAGDEVTITSDGGP